MSDANPAQSPPKSPVFVRVDPQKLVPSEGAIRAAKLRSNSIAVPDDEAVNAGVSAADKANWGPTTWHSKPIVQDVVYDNEKAVEKALEKLEALPPLVSPYEINKLQDLLRDAALGKAFVLQGGDCAELFDYCSQDRIESKMKILLQMSLVLIWGAKLPLVRIARIAGQFAKPRSKLTEEVDGKTIPSFRGDNINGFDPADRTPDPSRLVSAYFHSAATLNYIRSCLSSGFADLHRPFDWSLSHVQSSTIKERYASLVKSITEGLSFMKTVGVESSTLNTVDLFTSHEGLLLEFEQSLTRKLRDPRDGVEKWYNTSAHFLWIGDRTRQLNGAHVEYFRGIMNPIGMKVGPSMTAKELVDALDILDPDNIVGKVTLISRYGAGKVEQMLPAHIEAVKKTKHKVVWMCDPCHGNTKTSEISGLKTRDFEDIMSEVASSLQVHKTAGSQLHGIHLELTGDAVTECIGGSEMLTHEDLEIRYDTVCDPRLSESQSLDVAFLIADWFQQGKMMSIAEQTS
ncbi:DAHP synthetase [Myxozyma melibiosi]|uniref:Phospho-2-dehydro-3-deoxyheptonate aldolase n=1 Tax=Myxozyma melibiosi TaxID=54550 RepID=A0ABR1FBJ6_9ASCO